MFPVGEAKFGYVTHRSLEGLPQDTRGGFDLYSAQVSFALASHAGVFRGGIKNELP